MKTLFVVLFLVLGSATMATAQTANTAVTDSRAAVPLDFASQAARVTLLEPVHFAQTSFFSHENHDAGSLSEWTGAPSSSLASPEPTPAPEPRFVFGGRDDYRWQLGIGFAWTRFRSNIFNASAAGVNTSVTYFTNDWFGIEGNVNATFAPEIFANEHIKLLVYGAGPKIAWRQRRWEPWLHGLFGGIHEQPQTADNSRNGFAMQLGGGADYRWFPQFSVRLEGDYVRSSLFGANQSNFQLAAGFVFHF
jgi:opacity protein-like surface antigen